MKNWTNTQMAAIGVSVLSFLPTGLTVGLGALLTAGLSLGLLTAESDQERTVAVMVFGLGGMIVSFLSAPVLAGIGAVLHPLGMAAAWFAIKRGAVKSGVVLIPPHVVMLFVDLVVFLYYGSVFFLVITD